MTPSVAQPGAGFVVLPASWRGVFRVGFLALLRVLVLATAGATLGTAQAQSLPGAAPPPDTTPCAAVPAGAQHLAAGAVQAWWLPEPGPLRVGQAFALQLTLCPTQARLLRVDAQMPEHRHGMNYRPSVQALGAGHWRAEGLLWHMPGRWELLLETRLGEQTQRLTQSVQLR